MRKGGFDVVHIHEPLAPMAAYGLVLTAPLPMVGTYHRAGVSRWVPVLKPLVELVGRRMQVRVAVSEAARETGLRSGGGALRGAVQRGRHGALRVGASRTRRRRAARPCCSSAATSSARACSVLLDAFAMVERPAVLWVAGEGPATEVQRRRHPESDRVHWLGMLSDDEVAARLAGADVLCAPSLHGESFGMVLLEGMAAGCAVVASDIEGYRTAAGGHATLVPPGDDGGPVPCARRRAGRRRRGQRAVVARGAQGGAPSTPGPGRWTPWPSATSSVYERAIEAFRAPGA